MSPRAADFGKRGRRRHFARGLNTIGKEFVDRVLDRSRKLVDDCTGLTQRLRQWEHRDAESHRRCGVIPFELLLRAAEALRRHLFL